jgi:pyruvate kinase
MPDNSLLRRAKIVCTIGPASNSEQMIRELMRAGMDVARLNFSHGTHREHATVIRRLRKVAAAEGRSICILQDLQGPKIRTGRLKSGKPVFLKPGSKVTITQADVLGTPSLIATSFTKLADEVEPGSLILLSDGKLSLRVTAIRGRDVECEVIDGGFLGEHQGINLPGSVSSLPSLTDKDYKDLEFGIREGVDGIAMSFVRTADDVFEAKRFIAEHKATLPVIAKLEKPQAIDNLEAILEVADGVMVARGDLGVEVPPEKVPVIQKRVIRRAADFRKPVITATQMLESMIQNPRPTRAEASDVANAIFDGSDAVMLSGETAAGQYPREAVAMMARIVVESESSIAQMQVRFRRRRHEDHPLSIPEAICESVSHAAEDLNIRAIALYTESGNTARLISKYHPRAAVYAFAHVPHVCNWLNLYWGVRPVFAPPIRSDEEMVRHAERQLLTMGLVQDRDILGVVAGTKSTSGSTNFMRFHVVRSAGPKTDTRSGKVKSSRRRISGRKV